MKFRINREKTANGFLFNKWYRDKDGINKWKVVDHRRVSVSVRNVWRHSPFLTEKSTHVFCFSAQTNIWPEGTVIKVDIDSLLKE